MGYWRERSRAAIHPNIWFIVEAAARCTTLFCVCQSPVLTLPCRLVSRINKGPPASCRRQRRPRQIALLTRSGEIIVALMDFGSWCLTHPLPSSHRHKRSQIAHASKRPTTRRKFKKNTWPHAESNLLRYKDRHLQIYNFLHLYSLIVQIVFKLLLII